MTIDTFVKHYNLHDSYITSAEYSADSRHLAGGASERLAVSSSAQRLNVVPAFVIARQVLHTQTSHLGRLSDGVVGMARAGTAVSACRM